MASYLEPQGIDPPEPHIVSQSVKEPLCLFYRLGTGAFFSSPTSVFFYLSKFYTQKYLDAEQTLPTNVKKCEMASKGPVNLD
jgi:hypothetical protein